MVVVGWLVGQNLTPTNTDDDGVLKRPRTTTTTDGQWTGILMVPNGRSGTFGYYWNRTRIGQSVDAVRESNSIKNLPPHNEPKTVL